MFYGEADVLKTAFTGRTCASAPLRADANGWGGRGLFRAPVCPHVCPSASGLGAEVWAEGWGARHEVVTWGRV